MSRSRAVQSLPSTRTPAAKRASGLPHFSPHSTIQTKLAIGNAGDEYEHQADRAADTVMRMHVPNRHTNRDMPLLGSMVGPASSELDGPIEAPPLVGEVVQSAGQPLEPAARAFMEPRFGHDFSRVRIHSDAHAATSARNVGALAYTVGSHVVFGSGHYAPHSGAGLRLLAHELAHVVQQTGAQPGSALQTAPVLQRQSPSPAAPASATATAPCTPKQRRAIREAGRELRKWIRVVLQRLDEFAVEPNAKQRVAGLLQRHFGTRDVLHAENIRNRIEAVRDDLLLNDAYLRQGECPSDCRGDAHVMGKNLPVYYCSAFIEMDVPDRAAVLLHELLHVSIAARKMPGTYDVAYHWQRLYGRLDPTQAMDNADSFTEFVKDIVLGKTAAFKQAPDDMGICPKDWKPKITMALARAQAWVVLGLNMLGDRRPDYVKSWHELRVKYLHPSSAALAPGASVRRWDRTASDIDFAEAAFLPPPSRCAHR